ncbi:MAG: xanthine dehydrogenase accessory protein XdhC [Proteobacteria bacterium]|nr:xanthine dehydrogenase accessory protein XdhC [Pseudomonadota bacterium]
MKQSHCYLPASSTSSTSGDAIATDQHWLTSAQQWLAAGRSFILVTILMTQGSAPQKSGTKMLVSSDTSVGTIGGGALEKKAMIAARRMLTEQVQHRVCVWSLSASTGQCCGGKVALLLEHCTNVQPVIALFGIGHVGREVAAILKRLPYRLLLIDTYPEDTSTILPPDFPPVSRGGVEQIATLPPHAYLLIMTHEHELDFQLCAAAIRRGADHSENAFAYIGMIGSAAKAVKFRSRLRQQGVAAEQMTCPIGHGGRTPAEIAVCIAAEVIAQLTPAAAGKEKQAAAAMRLLAEEGEGR